MDILAGIILVTIILSPFVLIIFWAVRYNRRMMQRAWKSIQELLHEHQVIITTQVPEDTTSLPDISGETGDFRIRVQNYYTGTGKSRTLVTRTSFELKSRSLPVFQLYRENVFTRIGEMIGMEDIKTGDEEFDKGFRLKADAQDPLMPLFSYTVTSAFVQARKHFFGNISCKGDRLEFFTYSSPGQKIGLLHFRTAFDLCILLIRSGKKKTQPAFGS